MKKALVALLLLTIAMVAPAQDGLYAPVLPNDIALVRVVNATGLEDSPVTLDIGTLRVGPVAAGSGTPYHPVRPGVYVIFAGGYREPLTATSATFHTVLISAEGISVIEDKHHDDPLRSQLILYNGTTVPLRLDAIVPSAPLLELVEPGESGALVINAIPVTVAASRTDSTGDTPDHTYETAITLQRGASFALVVTGQSTLTGFVVTGEVSSGTD